MAGSATFTTDESMNTTLEPRIAATRVSRFWAWGVSPDQSSKKA